MKSEIDIQNLKKGIGRISETQGRRCLIEPIVCDIGITFRSLGIRPLSSLSRACVIRRSVQINGDWNFQGFSHEIRALKIAWSHRKALGRGEE